MSGWVESMAYGFFLGIACKSVVALGAAWLAAALLRRGSAAARHLVWTAAAAALLVLPLLSVSLPGLRLPVDPAALPTNVLFRIVAAGERAAVSAHPVAPAAPLAARPAEVPASDWRMLLLAIWAVGAAAAFVHMLRAGAAVRRLRHDARPWAAPDAADCARQLGLPDRLPVLATEPGSMPMTVGWLRPAILLPEEAESWSPERRRVVLLHELAHVRRGDVALQLLARIALNLYWWNPLAWLAWRQILKEREHAADDLVLRTGTRASDYAGHLLEIARTMRPVPYYASVAMARPSDLEQRLRAILDSGICRKAPGRVWAMGAGILAVGIIAPLAALQSPDAASRAISSDLEATIRAASAQRNPEILDRAAEAAQTRRQYDAARKLLEAALALRGQTSGTQSTAYGMGLWKLGQLARREGKPEEARNDYEQALTALGGTPESASVLIDLGTLALMQKDEHAAVDAFERARSADPVKAARAITWMAIAQERLHNFDEAESLFQQARALPETDPRNRATLLELYSQFLERQGRSSEAVPLRQQAANLRSSQAPSPSPATDRAEARVYRVAEGVTPPKLLYKVEPEYTEEAKAAGYEGTSVLYAEIAPDGAAHNLRTVRGPGLGLDEKAFDAVRQWKFQPGMREGKPVTVAATIEVNWRLF